MTQHQRTTQQKPWSLEVVRGRDVGRIFSLSADETVLGNGLNGEPGLDLSDQEGLLRGGWRRVRRRSWYRDRNSRFAIWTRPAARL